MSKHQPVQPVLVTDLIPEVRRELVRILESLSDADWTRPTVCGDWTVKDVALHILGDDVGLLSNMRDKDGQYFAVDSWEELVTLINAQNDLWVRAARRMSRRLLIHLLEDTGAQVYELFKTIDPFALGGPIGWAGNQPDPMWLHIARELTEYWTHHQHICDALNRTSLKDARFMAPVLATFVHALPRTFQTVTASDGTLIRLVVTGEGGNTWHLVREADQWVLYQHTDLTPASTITLAADTAWRLFTRNQPIDHLRPHITIEGDSHLGETILNTVAIIA